MNGLMAKSIADFVLRNFNNLPVYAEVHGEKKAFRTVDDALKMIDPDIVSSLVFRDQKHNVIGEIRVGAV